MRVPRIGRLTILAACVLVAGAAVAIGILFFRSATPPGPDGGSRTALVLLRLGPLEPGQTLEPGLPGLLRLEISSPQAERLRILRDAEAAETPGPSLPEMRIGTEQKPWWRAVTLYDTQAGSRQEIPVDVLEGRRPSLRLDRGETGYALIAIRPDSIPSTGEHGLVARVTLGWKDLDGVESESLAVVSQPGALKEEARLQILSRYFRETGRSADALQAARKLIEVRPQNVEGYVLEAEALEAMGRFREARSAYISAMDHSPKDSYEPPQVYDSAIRRLDRKIRGGTP